MNSLLPVAIALGVIFGVVAIIRVLRNSRAGVGEADLPYKRKDWLLTKAEQAFFLALRAAVPDASIFAKVRLEDLLYLPKGLENRQALRNRVKSRHVDFVICDSASRPLVAVELDDASHDRPDRRQRDDFVNRALAAAGLPLVRVRAAARYAPEALRAQLDEAVRPPTPTPPPQRPPAASR